MSDFYIMWADDSPDYISLDSDMIPIKFEDACFNSEFQHIFPKEKMTLELSEDSETIFPDFIYDESCGIPLISDKLKLIFDDFGIDNLVYQRIVLHQEDSGTDIECWLALPPKINCLNFKKSEFMESTGSVIEMVIDKRKVGRYDIFKVSGKSSGLVAGAKIIVTKRLYDYLIGEKERTGLALENVYFTPLGEQ